LAAFISWWVLLGAFAAACAYYTTYEYLHWCMHKPKHRLLERSGIFFVLNASSAAQVTVRIISRDAVTK